MAIAEKKSGQRMSVIVFARRPRPGRVKRRLARTVGASRAARIYADLLGRTLIEVERLRNVRRILMPAEAGDVSWFGARYRRRGWCIRAQASGDLGQRMARALAHETALGRTALLIGSDISDFVAADLEKAFKVLRDGSDVAIGPAADGGYWLIGLRRVIPEIFTTPRWGSAAVFRQTQAILADHGASVGLTALRHDIDRGRDKRVQLRRARSRSRRAT